MSSGLEMLPVFNKKTGFCAVESQLSARLGAGGKILAVFFQPIFVYIVYVSSG